MSVAHSLRLFPECGLCVYVYANPKKVLPLIFLYIKKILLQQSTKENKLKTALRTKQSPCLHVMGKALHVTHLQPPLKIFIHFQQMWQILSHTAPGSP